MREGVSQPGEGVPQDTERICECSIFNLLMLLRILLHRSGKSVMVPMGTITNSASLCICMQNLNVLRGSVALEL